MWKVWTDPELIVNWWGPNGFTNTIHQMDLCEGGEWRLTMHGPDGTNFANRSIFKEIVPFKKIVYEHFNPHFMRDIVIQVHKADKGLQENVERLGAYLVSLSDQT